MDVKNIEAWNNAYGLSKPLLRNIIVGFIVIQQVAIIYLYTAKEKAQTTAIEQAELKNNALLKKNEKLDSLKVEMIEQMYNLKLEVEKNKK